MCNGQCSKHNAAISSKANAASAGVKTANGPCYRTNTGIHWVGFTVVRQLVEEGEKLCGNLKDLLAYLLVFSHCIKSSNLRE